MIDKEILSGFSFFSGVSEAYLSEIAQWCMMMKLDPNETIFQDGGKAIDLFGVITGEVELIIRVRDRLMKTDIKYEESIQTHFETVEKEIIVDSIEPGEIFGWSALLPPNRFTTSARCLTPTEVFSLPAHKLKVLFEKHTPIGYACMERLAEIVSQRLRKRTDSLIESWSQAFGVGSV